MKLFYHISASLLRLVVDARTMTHKTSSFSRICESVSFNFPAFTSTDDDSDTSRFLSVLFSTFALEFSADRTGRVIDGWIQRRPCHQDPLHSNVHVLKVLWSLE